MSSAPRPAPRAAIVLLAVALLLPAAAQAQDTSVSAWLHNLTRTLTHWIGYEPTRSVARRPHSATDCGNSHDPNGNCEPPAHDISGPSPLHP
jgi:hypothetical protein